MFLCKPCCFVVLLTVVSAAGISPHIIFIIADDLGWNDVSFHGSNQIFTPNIDALAYNGVILNSHYVQPIGTPSRAALMTGKYPIRTGMQGFPGIETGEPRSLPEGKLLPQYLKDLGYSTHLIGKWHLGHTKWNDTPISRGFDSFLGHLGGRISYYDYLRTDTVNDLDYTGFDLWKDKTPAWDLVGGYATDVYTEHAKTLIREHDDNKPLFIMLSHNAVHAGNEGKLLEAPQEAVDKFRHIVDSSRRTYAGMVSKLDDSVGQIVSALQAKNVLDNSIIVFISDNGAAPIGPKPNWGLNLPLKGMKSTLWEGGVRSVGFIFSPLIQQSPRVSNELMHISDWLPTLYSAASGDYGSLDPELDGIDQWSSLVYDLPSPRNDILLNIDEVTRNAAVRIFNWKLIVGTVFNGSYDRYIGQPKKVNSVRVGYDTSAVFNSPSGAAIQKASFTTTPEIEYEILRRQASVTCLAAKGQKNPCDLTESGAVCLFDIPNDPCEENNLASFFPNVVRRMKRSLVEFRKGLSPQLNAALDIERADPKLFNYTWAPWLDPCTDQSCLGSG